MSFSQRIGKKPFKTFIQVDSMDKDLRVSLWNVLHVVYIKSLGNSRRFSQSSEADLFRQVWFAFFKRPLDEIPHETFDLVKMLKQWFFSWEWNEVYDFVEALISFDDPKRAIGVKKTINIVLEKELSGFRFVGDYITQITNQNELIEIEETLARSRKSELHGVEEHISSAIAKLSDKRNPDFRNSIKESVLAVESLCGLISGDPKPQLGRVLKTIKDKIGLHPALEKGFSNIYGYTSDADGIRHALMDETNCDFGDAKYMLISCCAFINYLIMKAQKAGIRISN